MVSWDGGGWKSSHAGLALRFAIGEIWVKERGKSKQGISTGSIKGPLPLQTAKSKEQEEETKGKKKGKSEAVGPE